jgi:putative aldouronate transport system substrate-binding protein
MNKRKVLTASAAVCSLAGLLVACNAAKETNPNENPSTTAPLEISMLRYERPSQPVNPQSVAIQEIAKTKNVIIKMQAAPQTNYDDKKKTLIATNTIPDVILVNQDDVQNYSDSGIFLDLTPYLKKGAMPNLAKFIGSQPEIMRNTVDGKLFGFPLIDLPEYSTYGGQLPMIRMDLLKKYNLKEPATFDELYQALKKFKEGNPKSFPFASRAANGLTGTENLLNPITFAFGAGYTTYTGSKVYYEPKTQKYAFGPSQPVFKDAIAWLNKLYSEKLLDPDYLTANTELFKQKLSSESAYFFYDNNSQATDANRALQAKAADANLDMLPAMAAPNGTKRNLIYSVGHLSESWVIRSNVKNPDQVVKFMDWFYSEEAIMLTNWGVKGEHYTITADGKPKSTDEFLKKYAPSPTNTNPPSYYSDLGAGFQQLGLVTDSRLTLSGQKNKWTDRVYEDVKKGINFAFVSDPSFTKSESEELKQIRSKIEAYLTSNIDKFIIQDGMIEKEWSKFVQDLKERGSDRMVEIYNAALARAK